MYQATPLKSDVTVSGLLSFIFHVSRIAGSAPLKFERVADGWRIKVSWILNYYNYLAAISFLSVSSIFAFGEEGIVDEYHPTSKSGFMRGMLRTLLTVQVITVSTIVVFNKQRLRHMIDCLSRMQHLHKELNILFGHTEIREIKTYIMVIYLLIQGHVAAFMEYGSLVSKAASTNGTVSITTYSFIGTSVVELYIQLFAIQFGTVVMRLAAIQEQLNKGLTKLLQDLRDNSVAKLLPIPSPNYKIIHEGLQGNKPFIINFDKTQDLNIVKMQKDFPIDAEMINQLINIYCSMCDIIRQLNASNGISLVGLLLYVVVHIVTVPYFIVTVLFHSGNCLVSTHSISLYMYCGYCTFLMVMVSEPCHQSIYELTLTRNLVLQMMHYTPKTSIENECLKQLRKHIALNPVNFCPMRLIPFNRRLLLTVLSAVVVNLSIFINLK